MNKKLLLALFSSIASLMVYSEVGAQPLSDMSISTGEINLHPIIDVSTDGGKTWSVISKFYNPIKLSWTGNPSCIGQGLNAMCVIPMSDIDFGGSNNGGSPFHINISQALIVGKNDENSGDFWGIKKINNLPPYKNLGLKDSACFEGEHGESHCVITGSFDMPDGEWSQGFIALSKDNGMTWNAQPIKGLDTNAPYYETNAVSCTGKGSNAVCVASASAQSTYALSSVDGGEIWHATQFKMFDEHSPVSCTGEGEQAVCLLAGPNLFAVTNDGTKSWSTKNAPIPADGSEDQIRDISCAGNGVNAFCIAIGNYKQKNTNNKSPLLLVSQDAGNTWSDKSMLIPSSANLAGISCTGSVNNGTCAILESQPLNDQTVAPSILISTDRGNTWTTKTIPGVSDVRGLHKITCKGEGEQTTCIAEFFQKTTDYNDVPLIAVSTDRGNTWNVPTVQGLPAIDSHENKLNRGQIERRLDSRRNTSKKSFFDRLNKFSSANEQVKGADKLFHL